MGSFKWQSTGAFVSLALWWVWISRPHLGAVYRKVLAPAYRGVDDSRELMSYRAAAFGLLISSLFVVFWLTRVGMESKAILLMVTGMMLVYFGATKIVADSGLIYTNAPASGKDLSVMLLGGPGALKASTHVGFGLAAYPMSGYRSFLMVPLAHINKLGDLIPRGKRQLFWGICAAFIVGAVVSTVYTIWLGYTIGAYNFQPNWLIINGGRRQLEVWVLPAIQDPAPTPRADYVFLLIGAAAMVIVNLMRYRFTWWPLHPIGLALSGMSLSRLTSTTIFVAWLAKYLTIRIAGAAFYRKSKPFFIGVLIGYILAVAAGIVVDSIWFPNQGHVVHKWY
jgi:hypothetical protein